jgi:hypothetical protein
VVEAEEGRRRVSMKGCTNLISESVSSDCDGKTPSRDEARNVLADDGFTEDSSVQDVSDGTVGTLPHLLKLEL